MKRRYFKKILRYIAFVLVIPIIYLILSLVLTYIPVKGTNHSSKKDHNIYLSSNGIHLEIIIPRKNLKPSTLNGLKFKDTDQFFSFGWGDKTFYIKTSTWSDFTILNKCKAALINTPALLHVTRYSNTQKDWVEIKINTDQLNKINSYIEAEFQKDSFGKKVILPGLGYYKNDDFYEATGKYNCFKTCNSWVNTGFKQSDLNACLWTPYDFRLLALHQKKD